MINDLLKQIERIKKDIYDKILSLPENEDITVISDSPKIFTVKFSYIVGNPLNVEYYSFKKQYEHIVEFLERSKLENFESNFKKIISDEFVVNNNVRYYLHLKVIEYLKTLI